MVFRQIFYPLISHLFDIGRGTYVEKTYQFLIQSQWWEAEKIRELQNEKLKKIIHHAYHNVPYYRSVFDGSGLIPEDINCIEDLNKIPFLTKKEIRKYFPESIVSKNVNISFSKYSSNGSTGEPIQFYKDIHTKSFSMAALNRSWGWAGYEIGDRIATFWGNRNFLSESLALKKRIKNLLFRETLFPAYKLSDSESFEKCLHRLRRFNPAIIFGYTQTLYVLAKYIRKYKIEGVHPKAIITTAETLSDNQRNLMEEQFRCKVFDQYGCGEVESIAYECEAHEGYHVVDEHVIVEFIKEDGKPVEPGERGAIVVTDLDNYIMPFIRYKNGDIGIQHKKNSCSCNRGLSKIERIEGRESDIIITPSGKALSLPSFYGTHILNSIRGIEQYQVIQESIDKIEIRIVTDQNFRQKDLNSLYGITKEYVGDQMSINIKKVPEIQPEENGKIKLVKSCVPLEEWLLKD